ncbi:MAG: YceI family protein [Ignavibacteriaceae bacterium]|jgi:polyisoprenoid-binding protein YceI|nr:YceI family protein [Ignavibacteriaceae bacterium]
MKQFILTATVLLLITASSFAQTQTWKADKVHSKVGFSVSHLVVSEVEGKFSDYDATLTTDANGKLEKVEAVIKVASITTDNADRDKHLKSDDFFAAEKYPELTFVSKSIKAAGKNSYKIIGDLTMRGVTKSVTLDTKFNGQIKDPWGNTKSGWVATTTVNRFDYGLQWNKALEAGGLVVGKDVDISLKLEFGLQK